MPSLKNILAMQAVVPMNSEKTMPALPKVSQVMTQLAAALPVDPMLPEIPVAAGVFPAGFPTEGFTQVVKGIEDALPTGIPKVSENLMAITGGGYRPIEEKKEPTKPARRILGGGYRSIG